MLPLAVPYRSPEFGEQVGASLQRSRRCSSDKIGESGDSMVSGFAFVTD